MTIKPEESLLAHPRAARAANEERFVHSAARTAAHESSTGWDPYEVWRTRVKNTGGYRLPAAVLDDGQR